MPGVDAERQQVAAVGEDVEGRHGLGHDRRGSTVDSGRQSPGPDGTRAHGEGTEERIRPEPAGPLPSSRTHRESNPALSRRSGQTAQMLEEAVAVAGCGAGVQ